MKKVVHFLSDPVVTMWSIIQYNVKVDHIVFLRDPVSSMV